MTTISARLIADSLSPEGVRLTTMELRYPRFFHSEVMTHRAFARNASSSRAIPVKTMDRLIREDPALPLHLGKNQRGMQAHEEIKSARERRTVYALWKNALRVALRSAKESIELCDLHKQIANRLTEPFQHMNVVVSATDWDNFFALRCHPDAEPHFRALAWKMADLYYGSTPRAVDTGAWHLPYLLDDEEFSDLTTMKKVSAARCARVSYKLFDGSKPNVEGDIALYDKLLRGLATGGGEPGHMCYDDKTEVLTSTGWKRWPEVKATDSLLAVDVGTKRAHWEVPEALHRSRFEGDLYHVAGQQLDLMVTPNHRMMVSRRHKDGTWTEFYAEAAAEVAGRPRRYLKAASLAEPSSLVDLPWPSVNRLAFLRFLGFFVGDGHAAGGNQARFRIIRDRKIDYLNSLGLPLKETSGHRFVVDLPNLGNWLSKVCYTEDRDKVLPAFVFQLSAEERAALLEGLRESDGSVKRKSWVYHSASKALVDQVQALLHLSGLTGSITSSEIPTGRIFRVNVSPRVTPRVETAQSGRSRTYVEAWVPYAGDVFCATVSTGALLVRRGDKVAVSGNSPLEHQATPLADPGQRSGPFRGWLQHRKEIQGENMKFDYGSAVAKGWRDDALAVLDRDFPPLI